MDKEELFTQFNEKVLPKLQEGLALTKDYAFDLFDRYITYLIVTDTIYLIISLALSVVLTCYIFKSIKWARSDFSREVDGMQWMIPISVVALSFTFILITIDNLDNLIKDIFIPEIRVYEEFNNINK